MGPLLIVILSIVILLLIYILLSLFVVQQINKKVFLIHGEDPSNPCYIHYEDYKDLKRDNYETYYFNKKIKGYIYYLEKKEYKGLVILSHGLFGTHIQYLKDIYLLASNGYKVLAYDQYGCGISEGKYQEYLAHGIYLCEVVINDVIKRKLNEDKEIILYGHSWGGYSICGALELFPNISKAIVRSAPVAPRVAGKDMIKKVNKFFYYFFFIGYEIAFLLLIPSRYRLKATIGPKKNKNTKILFIQSKTDDMVIYNHSLAYYYLVNKQDNCFPCIFESGPHNNLITDEGINNYKSLIKEYQKIKKETELSIQNNLMNKFNLKLKNRDSLYPLNEEVSNAILKFIED